MRNLQAKPKCDKKNYCNRKIIYLNQSLNSMLELTYALLDILYFRCSFKPEPRELLNAKTTFLRSFCKELFLGDPSTILRIAEEVS